MAKPHFSAVIFDMDGVVTDTARVHADAWKHLFDDFLRQQAEAQEAPFVPFSFEDDYLQFVDGKTRYQGVDSFLKSRKIQIPFGSEGDAESQTTVCGLGNKKDLLFNRRLDEKGVVIFPSTVQLIETLRFAGVKCAVVSSSKNCRKVLAAANLMDRFEVVVDGSDAGRLGLRSKPSPDMFHKAAQILGVAPQSCVVVEDALSGVQAGKDGNFGCVIGIDRHGNGEEFRKTGADLVVTDLSEISFDPKNFSFAKQRPVSSWRFSIRQSKIYHRLPSKLKDPINLILSEDFLRGSLGSFILRAGGTALRFLAGVVIARFLGASSYGYYAYAVTWLVVLAVPAMLGMDHILVRFIPWYDEKKDPGSCKGLILFTWLSGFAFALLVSVISILIVRTVSDVSPDAKLCMSVTLIAIPLVVLCQMQQTMMRGFNKTVIGQFPEHFFYPLVLLLSVLLFRYLLPTFGFKTAATINLMSWFVGAAVGVVMLYLYVPNPVRKAVASFAEVKQWLAMVPSLLFMNFAYQIMNRAPILLLGIMGTSKDVGIYSVSSKGAEFAEFFFGVVTLAGAPIFSSLYAKNDKEQMQRFMTMVTRTIFWVSLPAVAVMLIWTAPFLRLFGKEFTEGITVMRLTLSSYFLASLFGFVEVALVISGHQKDLTKLFGLAAALNVAFSLILIPRWGIVGAAVASSISILVLKILLARGVYKNIGILSLPIEL